MKDKLFLKDNTSVELEANSSLSNLTVLFSDKANLVELWDKLTEDNLSEVTIKNASDVVTANYTNLVLVNETSTITKDGVLTSFNLRQMTDTEIELSEVKKRLESLETSQTIQDESIDGIVDILGETEGEVTE